MTDQGPDNAPDETPIGLDEDDSPEALKAQIAALKDQALRYAADAENTRRRAEREINDGRAYAISRFAKDLLGVADNLARALEHAPKDDADPSVRGLAVGLEMTQKELLSAFERNGLTPIEPDPGAKFDPHQHQAVMEQDSRDVPAGSIVNVLQNGYELFGRVVRPAMVVVASKSSAPGADPRTKAGGASAQGEEAVSATSPHGG
jgi:molecular chaperone GrpE